MQMISTIRENSSQEFLKNNPVTPLFIQKRKATE